MFHGERVGKKKENFFSFARVSGSEKKVFPSEFLCPFSANISASPKKKPKNKEKNGKIASA